MAPDGTAKRVSLEKLFFLSVPSSKIGNHTIVSVLLFPCVLLFTGMHHCLHPDACVFTKAKIHCSHLLLLSPSFFFLNQSHPKGLIVQALLLSTAVASLYWSLMTPLQILALPF